MVLSVVYFFESRTTWADHITCGTSICIVYLYRMTMCNCLYSVIELCEMMMKGREKVKESLLFSKSTKGAARLNVPIRWTNR